MAGIKLTKFGGISPKVSPELLSDAAAQTANNCKLYSGDIIPYPMPVVVYNSSRLGNVGTLYALKDPDTDEYVWVSWEGNVNTAVASSNTDGDQRFYYTGDGVPKVSNYRLATSGVEPYPTESYDLGLPVPDDADVLTTVASTFSTLTTATFARDVNNTVTLTFASPHGLKQNSSVTVSGFSFRTGTYLRAGTVCTITIASHGLTNGATVTLEDTSSTVTDGTFVISNVTANTFEISVPNAAAGTGNVRLDIRNLNVSSAECSVVDSTTITYFAPGFAVSSTASTSGRVDLGSGTFARTYTYTWYTPWEEESIAAKPSSDLFIKEGITVTVSNIPTSKPAGDNFVRGVRLYRLITSNEGSEYFRLATLWFPTAILTVARTDNVVTLTTEYPHNLGIDDRVKIDGCTDATFNITGGVVLDIPDDYTFTYAQTDINVAATATAAGTLYYDVSEDPPTTAARYWGFSSYDFVDDYDPNNLLDALTTDNYDAPPNDMIGLTAVQNNILAGFVDNKLYFSEPSFPHAWPDEYAITLEYNIVGLAAVSGSLLVLTEGFPYIISGRDPAAGMSTDRVDTLYPCLNAKSIVPMGYGVVWSTHDGLAVYSPGSGAQVVTRKNYNSDTWLPAVSPETVVAAFFGDAYLASHSGGGFVFEPDPETGGMFVTTDYTFTTSYYDSVAGRLFYCYGAEGDIYEWDSLAQPPATMDWKSKVFKTADMINLGAARVVADYVSEGTTQWELVDTDWEDANFLWDTYTSLTFTLWADKQVIYTTAVSNSDMFRLPTGYRSDTFEVAISGNVRVRAIHLAETPIGLGKV